VHCHIGPYLFTITTTYERIWLLTFIMTRGKALSDDLRQVILNMACSLDINKISKYTGCKRRTIERIVSKNAVIGKDAKL